MSTPVRIHPASPAALSLVALLATGGAWAAGAADPPPASPTPATPARPAVANPHYVTIEMETTVDRPAAAVWARVGKYCDIAEWLRLTCVISSGKDGEIGAVRTLRNTVTEILVGKSEMSYTYTQPVMEGRPYNLYHGTLEAHALTPTTSKLTYTLVLDDSLLPDDAARQADRDRRRANFTEALKNMKILAEGGTLPPAPPAATGAR